MAQYKVPQDVEADDKLIGPFSFRQFIYLIIVVLAGALAWGLAQIFIGLAIIPLPVIIFFGALALPLRKDQPMEIYLAALVSFYLKPHKRLWDPDGTESLIEITAPKTVEVQRTKNLSQADAEERFSYLANIVDTQGWAIRGTGAQVTTNSALNNDTLAEAQSTQDVLDDNSSVGQGFEALMSKTSAAARQQAVEHMRETPTVLSANPFITDPGLRKDQPAEPHHSAYTAPVSDWANDDDTKDDTKDDQTAATTSDKPVSPDIMNLANNADLSIETIAHEAQRIHNKEDDLQEEVVISLR